MSGTDAAHLAEFLRSLNHTERYILLMYYADDLRTDEIALVLNLSEPGVSSLLTRLKAEAARILGLSLGRSQHVA